MGVDSTSALGAFLEQYLKRCTVVDGKIVPPAAPRYPKGEYCLFCGAPGGHGAGMQCPDLCSTAGRPDFKRGQ
jgi:hypothetical protein